MKPRWLRAAVGAAAVVGAAGIHAALPGHGAHCELLCAGAVASATAASLSLRDVLREYTRKLRPKRGGRP